MKFLCLLFLPTLIWTGCIKRDTNTLMQPAVTEKGDPAPPLLPARPWLQKPSEVCVDSYASLQIYLPSNPVNVAYVILENGDIIRPGGHIQSIIYAAEDEQNPTSLFRSRLQVEHTFYGPVQTLTSDVWSLGCKYQHTVTGPFTNIQKQFKLLKINTQFVWSVPPYNTQHLRVAMIVL